MSSINLTNLAQLHQDESVELTWEFQGKSLRGARELKDRSQQEFRNFNQLMAQLWDFKRKVNELASPQRPLNVRIVISAPPKGAAAKKKAAKKKPAR